MARHRSTGWGHGGRLPGPRSWLFFNFDVDSPLLKIEHRDMLKEWVVPEIKLRHGISIIGLASRTGFHTHNVHLSQKRADKTLEFLRSEVRNDFRALNVIGLGELAAAKVDRDGTEDQRFRSVVVVAGTGPVPPPPPGKVDLDKVIIDPKVLPGRDVADDIQWGWPPLRKPYPHPFTMPDRSVNQSEWMEGKREGCEIAYDLIKELDAKPKVLKGESKPTSGRQLLARMISQYGGGLKKAIQRAYEKKIGKSWPIMG